LEPHFYPPADIVDIGGVRVSTVKGFRSRAEPGAEALGLDAGEVVLIKVEAVNEGDTPGVEEDEFRCTVFIHVRLPIVDTGPENVDTVLIRCGYP